jgi:hypothetical protein
VRERDRERERERERVGVKKCLKVVINITESQRSRVDVRGHKQYAERWTRGSKLHIKDHLYATCMIIMNQPEESNRYYKSTDQKACNSIHIVTEEINCVRCGAYKVSITSLMSPSCACTDSHNSQKNKMKIPA